MNQFAMLGVEETRRICMGLSLFETIVVVFCILLALAGFIYYMIIKYIHERELNQSEFIAELDILSEKLSKQEEQKKNIL